MPRPNPCLTCGACCAAFRVSFYFGEASHAGGPGVPIDLTEKCGPFRLAMRGTNQLQPRCIALEGEVGGAVRCTIHPQRSSTCRGFTASWRYGVREERCDEARARYGLPPLNPEDWDDVAEERPAEVG